MIPITLIVTNVPLMQVSTNLADHKASTIRLQDISIAGARLPDTQIVILRNDIQKTSDPSGRIASRGSVSFRIL
jgi:hypothetical protein